MRLISLRLENFRQHKSTEVHFPSGLTGILGANGSGKSTILEAIAWVLYGNQAGVTRGETDTLIWRLAPGKSSAIAELTFAFNGQTYTVKRSQSSSKSTAELRHDGKTIANSIKSVNEKLTQLLGMTHQEFFNSYFTGQKDLNFLGAIKGATERERFIAKMLGYERLSEVQGAAGKSGTLRDRKRQQERQVDMLAGSRGDLEAIAAKIKSQQAGLADAQTQLEQSNRVLIAAVDRKQGLEPQLMELERDRDRFQSLDRQRQVQQANLEQINRQIAQLSQEREHLAADARRYNELSLEVAGYEQMQAQEKQLAELKQSAARKGELQSRLAKLAAEISDLHAQLEQLENIPTSLQELQAAIATFQTQHQITASEIQTQTLAWQEEQADLRARIKAERQNLKQVESQKGAIALAGHEGICPTCERPLHEEYDTVIERFHTQISHTQSHISAWQSQLDILQSPPDRLSQLQAAQIQLDRDISQAQAQEKQLMADLAKQQVLEQNLIDKQTESSHLNSEIQNIPDSFDSTAYGQLVQELQRLKPKYEDWLRSANAPQRLSQIDIQLADREQEKIRISEAIAQIDCDLAALNFIESEYQQVKAAIATVTEELDTARQNFALAQQQVVLATRDLEVSQQQEVEFHQKDREYQAAKQELILLDELDRAFTDLRQYLTEQIRPQLADSASIFLNQLTDGRYNAIEIDSKYNVVVLDDGDRKPVISGGEEDIVNLCLRLAISQMITERSGQPFSLLVLDEVFGSLDDGRRDNVLGLLHALEQHFEQVLIITHIESTKESLNHTIRLEFDSQQQCSRLVS
ncbi:AAA family ATPase [Pseudanabaena sp. PCC 6802]|uniref:AAA family ATPase n=1 Tax=Pseudanabaena sp. PCC 6802 TaxID=118173 RepID=UPI00034D3681|nr:SMC family ATPase [Pseudanabaena sp. PCC 6802]